MIKIANKSKQPSQVIVLRKNGYLSGAFTTDGNPIYFYDFDIRNYGECQVNDAKNNRKANFNGSGPYLGHGGFAPDVIQAMLETYSSWLENQHEDDCDCDDCHPGDCECSNCMEE